MTLTLIRKELRQHWASFLALGAVIGMILLLIAAATFARGLSGTVLDGIRGVLLLVVPAAAAVVCGRLIVAEYRAKTQLFLEALPLSRARMVVVKYLLGLAFVWLLTMAIILAAAVLGAGHDLLSPRFLGILLARGLAYAAFWHSFFFATGLLGRYRWPILILLAIAVVCVDQSTSFDLAHFSPIELLGERFAHERVDIPRIELGHTFAWVIGLSLFGLGLALVNEGNVSSMLAEKMSHREKVSVGVVMIGALLAIAFLETRSEGQPLDLPGATEAAREGVHVRVAGESEPAEALAGFLADELLALRGHLGIGSWPDVFVSERADLDADKFERSTTDAKRGFLVRANHADPGFERERFLAWIIGELLDHRSHGRSLFEPSRWARDGIGDFWASRSDAAFDQLTLRAIHGTDGMPPTAETFRQWLRVRERTGDGIARGMGFSALKSLERHAGKEACREFLRSLFEEEVPHNFLATLRDWRDPPSARLRRTTTLDENALAARWRDDLASHRTRLESKLASLPRVSLAVRLLAESSHSIAVEYRIDHGGAPASGPVRVRYDTLPPLDLDTEESKLGEEIHPAGDGGPHRLPDRFQRGSRLVIGAAVRVPELGCDVISGWRRFTLHPGDFPP